MARHKTIEDLVVFNGKCVRCSLCKFPPLAVVESKDYSCICPSIQEYQFHSHSGGGRLIMTMSLINHRVDTITDEARDAIFQCTMCGGCDMACKFSTDIEILEGLYALRAESFKRVGPLPGHKKVLERMEQVGHPIFEHGKKGDWLNEAGLSRGMTGKDTLLFIGDRYALLKEQRETLLNLVKLLKMGGVDFGLLGDEEPSTGRQALDIGDQALFDRHAEQTADAVKRSGAKTVICADALDFNAMRAHLPKAADLDGVRVVHAVQVLDELVNVGKIKPRKRIQARIAYHDPCSLGRLSEPYIGWKGVKKKVMQQLVVYDPPRPINRGTNGCYEPPRRILRSIPGVELKEFYRRREYAFCCGGEGMAYAAGYTEFVNNTALHRMEEAKAVGVDVVATACPNCDTNLGHEAGDVGIQVRNVIDLLAESVKG